MQLSKNKKNQYLFFFILCIYTIFNGGNSNLLIQINFILISLLFLHCLKDKNYFLHLKIFNANNKLTIFFYLFFLLYLLFQIVPLPVEYLKIFSVFKYNYISKFKTDISYSSISLSPSNSFFQLLNFISLLILIFIVKMIFYTSKHKIRLLFFLTFLGAIASGVAVYFYLIGNPNFWIIKNFAKFESTGFFINRTVFSCFLTLCFLAGIEYLKMANQSKKKFINDFYYKIYVRIFLLFITIGIITSYSKLGNFLFLSLITIYIFHLFYKNEKKNKFFLITLVFILLFDVIILGFYFGSERLITRFSFLQDQIYQYLPYSNTEDFLRADIVKFALHETKSFIFFGYGGGGFETLYKINYKDMSNTYASHAHSDLIEFIGEFGLIGLVFFLLSILFLPSKKHFISIKNFFLFYFFVLILIFDFSLHIPIIQLLFIILFTLSDKKKDSAS